MYGKTHVQENDLWKTNIRVIERKRHEGYIPEYEVKHANTKKIRRKGSYEVLKLRRPLMKKIKTKQYEYR